MDSDSKLFIKDLNVKTRRGYLCVRVMRKWEYNANIPGGPVIYIGLVFADELGRAIYAQIPQTEVLRLGPQLQLDQVYTIRKFSVRVSKTNYVPVDEGLMIQITPFTTIIPSKVSADAFPKIVYRITPFNDIKTSGSSAARYIDVIGIVVSEDLPKTACPKGKEHVSTLKEITIKDLSNNHLTVTLWEELVHQFRLQDTNTNEPLHSVVVLFCGVLPKKIFNKTQVNAGGACRWFINPNIEEAQPFYESLRTHPVPIKHPAGSSTHVPPIQPRVLQHKTIAEMDALDPYEFPETGCKCTVSITEIPPDQEWWYMGCEQCKRRLRNNGGTYYCAICSCSTAIPLYKLTFIAEDDTGSAAFFAYDVNARQIIRRNCDSLLRSLNNVSSIPDQLLRIIGKKFCFAVGLTDQSYRSMTSRAYLVDSCTLIPLPQHQPVPGPLAIEASSSAASENIQEHPSSNVTDHFKSLKPADQKDISLSHTPNVESHDSGPASGSQVPTEQRLLLSHDLLDSQTGDATHTSGSQTPPHEIEIKEMTTKKSAAMPASDISQAGLPHSNVRKRLYTDPQSKTEATAVQTEAEQSNKKQKQKATPTSALDDQEDVGKKKPKKT